MCSLGQHSKVYQRWFIHWSCSVCSRLLNCKFRRHQRSELETILEITRSNSSPLAPISPNGLVTGQDVPDDTQRLRWAKNPACELSSSALSTLCPPQSCSDGHHCSWELRPTTSVSHSSASHICVRDCHPLPPRFFPAVRDITAPVLVMRPHLPGFLIWETKRLVLSLVFYSGFFLLCKH